MPGFNIENFKANFDGGARQYLFYFLPTFPGGVSAPDMEKASYLVRATSLPETTLEEIVVNWQGYDFKMAGKYTYADFTVTFNVDVNAEIRKGYENWMELIHHPETNVHSYVSEYMITQNLQLLGYDGNPIMTYQLHNAWPKTVGAVTLEYATNDVAQFDVTFSYQWHTTALV